jgi:hypothetical protein
MDDAVNAFLKAVQGSNTSIPNEEGVPKAVLKEIIKSWGEPSPGINTALFIASAALLRKKTWTGSSYAEHYLRVSGVGLPGDFISDEEKIVGILHDVVEDSDWTTEDLEEIGFSPAICEGVRSVTKMDGELYLDASKRASINLFGRHVKRRDNKDNMDLTRSTKAATDKQKFLYHISYSYLSAVEEYHISGGKDGIPPNYSIWKFLDLPKYTGLLTAENVNIVAQKTLEPIPQKIATKFGLTSQQLTPSAA